jgi:hypothetical protein
MAISVGAGVNTDFKVTHFKFVLAAMLFVAFQEVVMGIPQCQHWLDFL